MHVWHWSLLIRCNTTRCKTRWHRSLSIQWDVRHDVNQWSWPYRSNKSPAHWARTCTVVKKLRFKTRWHRFLSIQWDVRHDVNQCSRHLQVQQVSSPLSKLRCKRKYHLSCCHCSEMCNLPTSLCYLTPWCTQILYYIVGKVSLKTYFQNGGYLLERAYFPDYTDT